MEAIKRSLSNKLKEYVAIILDEYQRKNEIKNMLTDTTNEDGQKGKNDGIKN